jgi:DNA-directed RNA polymerase specialized sigma54-like protein
VAACDMRECLLIQARFQNFVGTIVEKIIMDHLGDLENRKFDKIVKGFSVPVEQVISAVTIIQGLEPKPGRGYSGDETIYVTPDIYIFKVGDDYEILRNWSSVLFIVKYRAIIISKRRELITKKQLFLLFSLKVLNRFAIFSREYVNPYFFEERRVQ